MLDKICSVLICILMSAPLIIVGILFIISTLLIPNKIHLFGRLTSISVLRLLFVNIKINGTIPKDRPLILMFNHSSFIDPFLFAYCSPGKTTGITAVENYKYPIFGWMLKKWRAIAIDRKDTTKAKQSIEQGEKALQDNYNVIILPEGTRTTNGKIRKFKKGGFHMAMNIKAPILPIGSKGAYEFKPKNRWYIKPGTITLNIGEIIEPEEFELLGINGLTENVRQQLHKLTGYELEEPTLICEMGNTAQFPTSIPFPFGEWVHIGISFDDGLLNVLQNGESVLSIDTGLATPNDNSNNV